MHNPYAEKVLVTFRQETDYTEGNSNSGNPCYDIAIPFYQQKYIMEVRSSEFWADIETTFNPTVSKDVIASCLMAGMKLVPNYEMVYEEVASQIRNGIGISVNREVSPMIARITEKEFVNSGIPHYFIVINEGVGHKTPACELIANYIEEENAVRLDFNIRNGVHKMKVSAKVDAYFFKYESDGIIKEQQFRVISELHQKFPEMGAEWEMLRVQWFGEGETLSKQGADSWVGQKPKPQSFEGSGRDPRVSLLPGLNAEVKHPVTGRLCRLEDAIISLNDNHGWSREQVADWLETLDVDITFKVSNEQD